MEFYQKENNNFGLVRMLAAYMVIYAHAYVIQPNGKVDIIARLSGSTHAGQIAVFIFIFLSGLYITRSLWNETSVLSFYIKRFMRIWPLLFLAVVMVIIMGAFLTDLSFKEYFLSAEVRTYFVKNLVMIENSHFLPGVFTSHLDAGVNGVLWFITFQARIYLCMGIFKSMNLLSNRTGAAILFLTLIIWSATNPNTLPLLGSNYMLLGNVEFPQYVITFCLGGALYLFCPQLQVKWYHSAFLLLLCMIIKDKSNSLACWATWGCVTAIWIGTNKYIQMLHIRDCSYGIFLFAWPISQLFRELIPAAATWENIVFTIITSTAWALLINCTLEKQLGVLTKKILQKSNMTATKKEVSACE